MQDRNERSFSAMRRERNQWADACRRAEAEIVRLKRMMFEALNGSEEAIENIKTEFSHE